MLDNIIFSVNAVVPLVILIFLGFCLKQEKLKLFKEPKDFFNQVDRFVFHVAFPIYIFNELSKAEIEDLFNIYLVVYCVSGILISVFLSNLIVPLFIKSRPTRGAFIQGIFRSNFAMLGVPLAGNLFGDLGLRTAALVLPFPVVMFNTISVIVLAVNADSSDTPVNQNTVSNVKKIILGIITNPLIIGIVTALPFMLLKISLPTALQKSINYGANMATPLALISLGAGIDLKVLKNKVKLSFVASLIKTTVCPLLFVVPAVLLGFRDAALVVIFVLFGAPTAVSSYIMAKNMKSDYELAGQIVVLTTVICPVTVFTGSFILKSLGLI